MVSHPKVYENHQNHPKNPQIHPKNRRFSHHSVSLVPLGFHPSRRAFHAHAPGRATHAATGGRVG